MKYKLLSSFLIIIIVTMSVYVIHLRSDTGESDLISQIHTQAQQINDMKNSEMITKNMIQQYISENNQILAEVASSLPILKFKTEEEQSILNNAKQWVLTQEGLEVLKGKIVISMTPKGLGDNNLFLIDLLFYEKHDAIIDLTKAVGKEYIQYGQLRMKQSNGDWIFAELVDKF